MFKFFKKKTGQKDPILESIERNTKELEILTKSLRKEGEELKAEIKKKESMLHDMGYTDKDLEKIRMKAKLKVIK